MTLTAGTLRRERIHVACATPAERLLTWMAFWHAGTGPNEPCPRCGKSLREAP